MINIVYKYFLLIVIAVFFAGAFAAQPETKTTNNTVQSSGTVKSTNVAKSAGSIQFCSPVEDLIKKEEVWVTKDNRWKSYTSSTASKVLNFLGAQWAGVKIGKIICLYQTNEAVAFPLAVEQLSGQSVLEPKEGGWSALTNNRRFCKSVSIADCPFFPEAQKDTSNIYKDIEYNPGAAKDGF